MQKTSKASVASQSRETETVGVRVQTEVIYREDGVIPFTKDGGHTLGEMLDRQLADLAKHNGTPHSFTYSFDTAAWEQAKPLYEQKWEEYQSRSSRFD